MKKGKQFLSLLLCTALTLTLLPVTVRADIWGGGSQEPAHGGGSSDAPYQIATADELAWFARQVNSGNVNICAELTDDIVLNDTTDWQSWATDAPDNTWTPIGNDGNRYTGSFDGKDHTVSGIYINTGNYLGLFGYVKGGNVQNVGVIQSYIGGASNIGAVCGMNNTGSITSCYNRGNVTAAGSYAGGICGHNISGSVTGCFNFGTVRGTSSGAMALGGVCGVSTGASVTGCGNLGNISGAANGVGGVCGSLSGMQDHSYLTNSYNFGLVQSQNANVGGICGQSIGGDIAECYFLDTASAKGVGMQYSGSTVTKSKTTEQFASGEVAYLLGVLFGQTIGTDTFPRRRLADDSNAVFKLTYMNGNAVHAAQYYNSGDSVSTASIPQPLSESGYFREWENLPDRMPGHDVTAAAIFGAPVPPVITTDSLPDAAVGRAYSVQIMAGGTQPITFAVSPGSTLPEWLSLDTDTGVLSGTPTAEGSSTFTVKAANPSDTTDEQALSVTVKTAPLITTDFLPNGMVSVLYSAQIMAGGTRPITFSISPGSTLPEWLSLNTNTGVLSGTPTAEGTFTFGIRAANSPDIAADMQELSITVEKATPEITTNSMPDAAVGKAYSVQITASGLQPITFAVSPDSSLPEWLSLDTDTGVLYGTPTAEGTFTFSIQATNNTGTIDRRELSIKVKRVLPIITIDSLPPGYKGTPYSALIPITGIAPITYEAVSSDGLPAGLSLNANTGEIAGTPTTAGTFTFIIRVTDIAGFSEKQLSIVISAAMIGDGTQNNPYQIRTAQHLQKFAQIVNDSNASRSFYAILMNDIALNDVSNLAGRATVPPANTWTPIGYNLAKRFTGGFDGGGHTISGIYVNASDDYKGLFGYIGLSSLIQNVNISDSYIKGNNNVGSVSGAMIIGSTISNCHNSGTIIGAGTFVGGLCGYVYNGTVTGCRNTGSVTGGSSTGGILGSNDGTVTGCRNEGTISSTANGKFRFGGIAGSGTGSITNVYNTGSISAPNCSNVAGICGMNTGIIANAYNAGTIAALPSNTGQICGFNAAAGRIINCYFLGNLPFGGVGNEQSGTAAATNITTARFNSGEAAYLLGGAFGQRLGIEGFPVFRASDGSNMVYRLTYTSGSAEYAVQYYNSGNAVSAADIVPPTVESGIFSGWDGLPETMPARDVTVNAIFAAYTYTIEPVANQNLTALTADYAAGTQESRTITITRTGTGDLTNLTVTLSGDAAGSFTVSKPAVTSLNNSVPSTTFDVAAIVGLTTGTYTATVTISADDMTDVTFTVTQLVNAAPSNDATLSGLSVTGAELNESFSPSIYAYTASVSNSVTSVSISASVNEPNATMTLKKDSNPAADWDGTSVVHSLKAGDNVFTIAVTAQDGKTMLEYTITIMMTEIPPVYSITASPTGLYFGGAAEGYTEAPAAQTVTIENTGNQSVTLTLSASTNYVIGSLSYTTLAAGEKATFTIRPMTGLFAGNHDETITISAGGSVNAQVSIYFTVTANKALVSIAPPAAITGVANGTAKTAAALRLPSTVTLFTDDGDVSTSVTWYVYECSYDPSDTDKQTFTVDGAVTLPAGVSNPNNISLSISIEVTVNAASPVIAPPEITTDSPLPGGTVGSPYTMTLTAASATTVTWAVYGGNLPDGLRLSSDGIISGTPKAAGNYIFTVLATNSVGADTRIFTINIKTASGGDRSTKTYYTVSAEQSASGTITLSAERVRKGGSVIVTITPDEGYVAADVLVNGRSVGAIISYTIENITADTTVKAVFEPAKEIWENPFFDVASDAWYYDAVAFVSGRGLFNGTSGHTFGPDAGMTRGMLVTVLLRLSGEGGSGYRNGFSDVAPGAWYENAAAWAAANGIASGVGGNRFAPDEGLTREQLAVMLYNYARYKGFNVTTKDNALDNFADASDVSGWASEAIRWAVAGGIITGRPGGNLNPKGFATRAEVAAMLMKFAH